MKNEAPPFDPAVLVDVTREASAAVGASLGPRALERLLRYAEAIREGSTRMNLTAILDDRGIAVKHFADSLSVLPVLLTEMKRVESVRQRTDSKPFRILDVGTGAGLPGIPLCIALEGEGGGPATPVVFLLLDALAKRVGFLHETIASLGLTGIDAVHARAEDAARGPLRESCDFVVARAVAPLNVLLEYGLPFVRTGGLFVAMKGPDPQDETVAAARALDLLGGRLEGVRTLVLPVSGTENQTRSLVLIRKSAPCPAGWPRSAGKPEKAPIL